MYHTKQKPRGKRRATSKALPVTKRQAITAEQQSIQNLPTLFGSQGKPQPIYSQKPELIDLFKQKDQPQIITIEKNPAGNININCKDNFATKLLKKMFQFNTFASIQLTEKHTVTELIKTAFNAHVSECRISISFYTGKDTSQGFLNITFHPYPKKENRKLNTAQTSTKYGYTSGGKASTDVEGTSHEDILINLLQTLLNNIYAQEYKSVIEDASAFEDKSVFNARQFCPF